MSSSFALDPQLARDSHPLAALPLSELRLMNDARFPWLLLVPRRLDVAEIIDLADIDRAALFDEMVIVSTALRTVTGAYKINVAALGNIVRQLHVHVIARFQNDAAWPRPVWGSGAPVSYEAPARDKLIGRIKDALPA